MRKSKIISLFDGMSCGRIAMDKSGFPVETYHAAEIEKWPVLVSAHNYRDITHIGNVCNINPEDYKDYDVVIGGSPCQSMSPAGKKKGLVTNDGQIVDSLEKYMFLKEMGYTYEKKASKKFTESTLFWEFVRIYRGIQKYNPGVKFLLENVVNEEWGKLITKELGVEPITINSSLIVPQNRNRNYWTNIEYTPITPRYSTNVTTLGIRGATPVVQRKELTLDSIIPGAVSGAGSRGVPQKNWVKTKDNPCLHKQKQTVRKDGLANCLTASAGECCRKYLDTNGDIQVITVEQAEQLQTVPVGYTDVPGVSNHQRFKMLGNGWTVDVIAHFFSCLKKEIESKSKSFYV